MKTKTFSPKLSLNKKTIANLNNKEMKNLIGGIPITWGPNSCFNTICYTMWYNRPCNPIT
jgi:natural product precursor